MNRSEWDRLSEEADGTARYVNFLIERDQRAREQDAIDSARPRFIRALLRLGDIFR